MVGTRAPYAGENAGALSSREEHPQLFTAVRRQVHDRRNPAPQQRRRRRFISITITLQTLSYTRSYTHRVGGPAAATKNKNIERERERQMRARCVRLLPADNRRSAGHMPPDGRAGRPYGTTHAPRGARWLTTGDGQKGREPTARSPGLLPVKKPRLGQRGERVKGKDAELLQGCASPPSQTLASNSLPLSLIPP